MAKGTEGMGPRNEGYASAAGVIVGETVVVPLKVLWVMAVLNMFLLGGYVMLFGWFVREVVDLGKSQARLE